MVKVFITGASSGLGLALAQHYARLGATLGLFARRATELEQVATALAPARVATYPGDVRDADALARSGADFIARFGVPDIVIGNAGISRGTLTSESDDMAAFRAVFDTNMQGLVQTFAPFVNPMTTARSGVLVGVASVAGFRGLPGSGAYSASKAAAIAYLESLRVELRGTGVSVLTICPGFIATPMTARNPYAMPFMLSADEAARRMARAIASKRPFYVLPWQMAIVAKALRVMPRFLYDFAFARSGRKPRQRD
jgi:short-subunit dehydrogenase